MVLAGGIVLCGGQSKRMGRPKAWLPFGNELMLQRIVRIVDEVVRPVVVVAAADQGLPALPDGVVVARDEVQGQGPLQGLAAGLQALKGQCEVAYVSSCDVPLLRPAFVKFLVDKLENYSIAVPRVEDKFHPLAAVYRVDIDVVVLRLLAEHRLRPAFLFDQVPTRIVDAQELMGVDPTLQSLRNLNTEEDYKIALRDAGFTPDETGGPTRGA